LLNFDKLVKKLVFTTESTEHTENREKIANARMLNPVKKFFLKDLK